MTTFWLILFCISSITCLCCLFYLIFINSLKVVELEEKIKFLEKQLNRLGEKK